MLSKDGDSAPGQVAPQHRELPEVGPDRAEVADLGVALPTGLDHGG